MIQSIQIKTFPEKFQYAEKTPALQGFKATFTEGLNLIVGPNGSGKSTILKVMAALTHSLQGGITKYTGISSDYLRGDFNIDLVTDGQPVAYMSPDESPGLFGGSFDYDFFEEGVRLGMLGGSQGENANIRLNMAISRLDKREIKESDRQKMSYLLPQIPTGRRTLLLDEYDRSLDILNQVKMLSIFTRQVKYQIILVTHNPLFLMLEGINIIELVPGYTDSALAEIKKAMEGV